MSHELKTARLDLRQLDHSDWSDFLRLLQSPEVFRYCFDAPSVEGARSAFELRLDDWTRESTHWLCLSVYDRSNGDFVGVNGFRMSEEREYEAEVGFLFLPEYHGKGYATESLRAIVEYAKICGVTSLHAHVTEGNKASCCVLEKCGFSYVGKQTELVCINKCNYSDLLFSLRMV